jgi:HSP20 family protein
MKLDLSKWGPFKFGRRMQEQPQASSRGVPQPQAGDAAAGSSASAGMPAAWLDRQGLPEPMRMMGDFLRDPFGSLTQIDRWFGDFSPGAFQPRIDVVDDGDALRITAELPGMERQDVEVLLEDEYLVLRGDKRLEAKGEDREKGCYHVERSFGSFQRIIPLPDGVDAERAEAKFENGTLTIRLPKVATARARERRLEIRDNGHDATAAKH